MCKSNLHAFMELFLNVYNSSCISRIKILLTVEVSRRESYIVFMHFCELQNFDLQNKFFIIHHNRISAISPYEYLKHNLETFII